MPASLPTPGGDTGVWGTKLNTFLQVSLNNNGTLKQGALETANVVQSTAVRNVVTVTQSQYNALTPNANTLYIVT